MYIFIFIIILVIILSVPESDKERCCKKIRSPYFDLNIVTNHELEAQVKSLQLGDQYVTDYDNEMMIPRIYSGGSMFNSNYVMPYKQYRQYIDCIRNAPCGAVIYYKDHYYSLYYKQYVKNHNDRVKVGTFFTVYITGNSFINFPLYTIMPEGNKLLIRL